MTLNVPFFKGRKRRWFHKSVVALMGGAYEKEEPPDVIRRLARAIVSEALPLRWEGPPYNPETLASLRGIEIKKAKNIGAEARIIPKPNRKLCIEYDPLKPQKRINFSICHELAHTLFPDHYETSHHRNASTNYHMELECLCDIGGAELLMPHEPFLTDLAQHTLSLATVHYLSERYQASSEAILIRIAQLSILPCAVVFLSEKLKPIQQRETKMPEFDFGFPPAKPKLRVDYVQASPAFGLFIPPNKSVPDDSVAYQCLTANDIVEGKEQWDIRGFGEWAVQAITLPVKTGTSRRVVALVVPDKIYSAKNQVFAAKLELEKE